MVIRPGFYYSPDDKVGGGLDPDATPDLELLENDDVVPDEKDDDLEPEAKVSDEELAEFKAWKEAQTAPKTEEVVPRETNTEAPKVERPKFRQLAYAEAAEQGQDDDWAEDRALELASNWALDQRDQKTKAVQEQQAVGALQAAKPQIEEVNLAEIKKNTPGIPDDIAAEVAKLHTEHLMEFGLAAFDDGRNDTDPKVKAEKLQKANYLQRTSYLKALGLIKEKELKAAKSEADELETPSEGKPEPVSQGRSSSGRFAGFDAKDAKDLQEIEKQMGRKLTTEELNEKRKAWAA